MGQEVTHSPTTLCIVPRMEESLGEFLLGIKGVWDITIVQAGSLRMRLYFPVASLLRPSNIILRSREKEGAYTLCNSMDGTGEHYDK